MQNKAEVAAAFMQKLEVGGAHHFGNRARKRINRFIILTGYCEKKKHTDKGNCQNLLKRHIFHYLQRENFGEMSDAKHISVLDASAASWQVPLEKQSACLWAFNTLFERHFPQPVTWAEFRTRGVSLENPTYFCRCIREGSNVYRVDAYIWGKSARKA